MKRLKKRALSLLLSLCLLGGTTTPTRAVDDCLEEESTPPQMGRHEEAEETPETPASELEPKPTDVPAPQEETEVDEAPSQTEETEAEDTPVPTQAPVPEETLLPEETPLPEEIAEPTETPAPEDAPTEEEPPAAGEVVAETSNTLTLSKPDVSCFGDESLPLWTALQRIYSQLTELIYYVQWQTDDVDETQLCYSNGAVENYTAQLPKLIALFAFHTGLTPEQLDGIQLDTYQLNTLRDIWWELVQTDCTVTETDIATGELLEDGTPQLTHRRSLLVNISISPQIPDAWELTEEEIQLVQEWMDESYGLREMYLPKAISDGTGLRDRVVQTALSLQAQLPYQWGGKYDRVGWNDRWGLPRVNTSQELQSYGLDCSGLVSWVFINAAGTADAYERIGGGSDNQASHCKKIEKSAVRPGDLALWQGYSSTDSHIGIVVGFDSDSEPLVCSITLEGVNVHRADLHGMDTFLCPEEYYSAYESVSEANALPEPETVHWETYAQVGEEILYLLCLTGEVSDGSIWLWDNTPLVWSDNYHAWCALTTKSPDSDFSAHISRISGERTDLSYQGDLNGTGDIDLNDLQVLYELCQGNRDCSPRQWLEGDINGDKRLDEEDMHAAEEMLLPIIFQNE